MQSIRILLSGLILVFMVSISAFASSQTIEGQVLGLDCVRHKYGCPIDLHDPHTLLLRDFVLVLDDGDHYLLTNVPREVKVRFTGKVLEVTGRVNIGYRYIIVKTLKVKQEGGYKIVWEQKTKSGDRWSQWQKEFYDGETEN